MIRVGFILHGMHVAGAEMLVAQTIHGLRDRIEPTVFCLDSVGQLGEQLQSEGVRVECLHRKPGGPDWALASRLARRARELKIDVFHAHQYTPFFYAAIARLRGAWSTRLIMTEHGRHWPDVVSAKRRWVNRIVLAPLAHKINACCQFSADALARNDGFPASRIEVIPNGIPLEKFAQAEIAPATDLPWPKDRKHLGMVARFHPIKNHSLLIRGMAELAKQRDDVDLLLAGDGPLRGELETLTNKLGLTNRVRFLGVRNDVPAILSGLDVFLLTSRCEAAPLTILEAMAAGVPVVATRVGGIPEMIRDGVDGLLVDPDRPDEVAAAVLRLLNEPDLAARLVASAKQRVRDEFLIEMTIAKTAALYEQLAPKSEPVRTS
jgi:glycosyltransferase involved in cell wall biosynthesis